MMEVQSVDPRTLDSQYIRGQHVAQGSFGHVCKGVSRSDPNKLVAIKEIDRRRFDPEHMEILVKTVKRQIESNSKMRETKFPFIVQFIEYFETQNVVSFIFEYCEKTLYSLIQPYSSPNFFAKRQYILLKILYQMLLTLKKLEEMHMIHRDIKSDNILICEGVTKLGDFGFCREINENLTSGRGSLRTTAPQAHTSTFYNKCDIWSLGVTIHTCLYQVEPFQQKLRNIKDVNNFRDKIMSKQFSVEVRRESKLSALLEKMIVIQESQRSSVSQLLEHPIFAVDKIVTTPDWIRSWLIFSSMEKCKGKETDSTVLAIIGFAFSECKVSYQLYKTKGKQVSYFLLTFGILQLFLKMLDQLKAFSNQTFKFAGFISNHYNQSLIQGLIKELRATKKPLADGFQKLYKHLNSGATVSSKLFDLRNLCLTQAEAQIKSIIAAHYSQFVIFPTLNKIIEYTDKFKWGLNNIISLAFKQPLQCPKFYFNERPEYHQHISIF